MVLSNKGILPLLWEMYPDHPNLLRAYFDDDPKAATLGASYVRLVRARGLKPHHQKHLALPAARHRRIKFNRAHSTV
jgi:hypothetical protein